MEPFDWTCPFCKRDTTITSNNCARSYTTLYSSNFDNPKYLSGTSIRCPNKKCHQHTLSIIFADYVDDRRGDKKLTNTQQWDLIPESSAKPFPSYIPTQILNDYSEACSIKEKSPKASATLSRRCLQGIIRDYHGIKKRNLSKAINSLQGKIDPIVWKAIDAVRKVGNIGAHMEMDVDLIIDVDPKEAELLINLIERLFVEWYVARHNRKEVMDKVIELAESKEKARKEQSKSPGDLETTA